MKFNLLILISAAVRVVHGAAIAATPVTFDALKSQFTEIKTWADRIQTKGSSITALNAIFQYNEINQEVFIFTTQRMAAFITTNRNVRLPMYYRKVKSHSDANIGPKSATATFSESDTLVLRGACNDAIRSCQQMCTTLSNGQGNVVTSTLSITLVATFTSFESACGDYANSLTKVAPSLSKAQDLIDGFGKLKDLFTKLLSFFKGT